MAQGTGTNIGNMTSPSIANLFDGSTAAQTEVNAATGTGGKNYGGTIYAIERVKFYGTSTRGFIDAGGWSGQNVTFKLEESSDGSSWTQLASGVFVNTNGSPVYTLDSSTIASKTYVRGTITPATDAWPVATEIEFYIGVYS